MMSLSVIVQEYQKVVDAEWGILYDKLEKIVTSGAKVVLSKLPIGDVATQYFADRCVFPLLLPLPLFLLLSLLLPLFLLPSSSSPPPLLLPSSSPSSSFLFSTVKLREYTFYFSCDAQFNIHFQH